MLKDFLARAGWMTKALVAICLIVSIVTFSGDNQNPVTGYLTFNWDLILQGQVHRLVTPIFLHFMIGSLPIHLIFNMMWLWDLGGSIEKDRGPWYLLVVVLIIGILSNTAQFFVGNLMSENYIFGGMSGVVFGLLGFLFVRRKYDPFFRVALHPGIMQFMMIWLVIGFVLDLTGTIGIANTAHIIGLVVGGALGFITSKIKAF